MTGNLKPSVYNNPRDWGLLTLRIGFGVMMLIRHGAGKLAKFDLLQHTFADPLGVGAQLSLVLAISAEFGASLLLIAGFITRPAALMLLFTMGVAVLGVHWDDPLKTKEMGILYGTAYLVLLVSGPGKLSLDGILAKFYNRLPKALKWLLNV